ncbi:hypothetical protein J3L18_08150 [Mucilaginibacter gossypii]|uniref:hypothetical protein n=1 Tax=Mucilaginibacter gossypii TaxID=551996 RepID=UPI00287FA214|nr:hypothetical protein [Mucilaginibacter gossypii]QTE39014.2 hypothetical protein J3L18_08150 [Mucilaginibacter gossypii]
MNKRKLVFLSDDPPLRSKGVGISVLLYNILLALKQEELSLVTFCGNVKATAQEIREDNEGITVIICDAKFKRLNNIRLLNKIIKEVSFIISLRKIGSIINDSDVFVVAPIGASGILLWRFQILKFLFNKPKYGLYIVDDLEAINKKLNRKFENFSISKLLPRAIKDSNFLINISQGLRETYLKQFDKDSHVLLPHFLKREPLIRSSSTDLFTFLFTGGLSFLYNEPLLELDAVLNEINDSGLCNKKLRLQIQTYTDRSEFDALHFTSPTTFYSTVKNRDELIDVYNQCQCFIIPYSFNDADKQMIKTSFPQKVAEIIQYRRPILVYGPAYSSVVDFFNTNALGYVCDSQNKEKLKESVLQIVDQYQQFDGEKYISVYDLYLSAGMVNNVFDNIINETR